MGTIRYRLGPAQLALRLAVGTLIAIAVLFTTLPVAAIFLRSSPSTLANLLGNPSVLSALKVTLLSGLTAHIIVLTIGTPIAYVLARKSFRGRATVTLLLELPLVLPPAVAGIGLLAAFGRTGVLGSSLSSFGITIPFTTAAVIIAAVFVSGALYLRQAIGVFIALDSNLLDAARTLGASPIKVFFTVAIPLSMPGLEAASALALARGFGEFGATILFAGNLPGETQTLPLAIYALFDSDFDAALAASILLILIGVIVLITNKVLATWTAPSLR